MGTNPRQILTDFGRAGTPFPTPVSYDATPGGPRNHYEGLGKMAKHGNLAEYPTPTAQRGFQGGQGSELIVYRRVQEGKLSMEEALQMLGRSKPPEYWPTPVSSDGGLCSQKVESWADQALKHQAKGVNKQLPLSIAVKLYEGVRGGSNYPTPNAFDAPWTEDSVKNRYQNDPGKQKLLLQAAMEQEGTLFPTPRAREGNTGPLGSAGYEHNLKMKFLDATIMKMESDAPSGGQRKPSQEGSPPSKDQESTSSTKGPETPSERTGSGTESTAQSTPETSPAPSPDGSNTTSPPQASGQLNPPWVEWLMGFPIGWTDLDASETRSYRRSGSS
jgi:hypothetical protein